MGYKRILTIQDISCVGQCSMTVAMPILSACGHETCILPTAILSTHTGGFGKPEVVQLAPYAGQMWRHWQRQGITFDAILVGYLGSVEAVSMTREILEQMLSPGGIAIIDPAMADHGKLYAGFDEAYVRAMGELCGMADILLPNLTEAAMLTGREYREIIDEDYVNSLIRALPVSRVVLTGVGYGREETGVLVRTGDTVRHYSHEKVGGSCHGTGDIFAACFTGALMGERSLMEAVQIAADFTALAIRRTVEAPAHWYGVKFETALPELISWLGSAEKGGGSSEPC